MDWMDDSRQNGGSIANQDSSGYFGLAKFAENTLRIHQKAISSPLLATLQPMRK